MKVARKRPGEPWEFTKIKNSLEALQAEVGGYIKTIPLCSDSCLVVNMVGIPKGLPFNLNFCGLRLFGTVLLVGVEDDKFYDVPIKKIDFLQR